MLQRTLFAILLLCSPISACELMTMHGVPIYGSQVECSAKTTFEGIAAPETVVIPEGQTVVLSADVDVIDVLVRGSLIIEPGVTLKVRTLTVVGMNATLAIKDGVTLIFRDGPFEAFDTTEWGHGLLTLDNALTVAESDEWRQSKALVSREIMAGDQVIQLAAPPNGWRAGDTLVIPDTRQQADSSKLSEWTELVVIDSVTEDGIVYLTAPVQFEHLGWHDKAGNVSELFDVGCLTQPITFQSENPDGTRGHCAAVASGGMYLRGVQAIGMGRTKATEVLSATNRVGRYALWHFHHCYGRTANIADAWQGEAIHCSCWDSPKWPGSIHNSYFINLEDCFAYNCAGAGLVTEQVLSYGFQIKNCMVVAKQLGSGQRITDRSTRNDASPTADHWHDRAGAGLGSCMGVFTGNRMYCCKEGIGMAGFGTTGLYKVNARGVDPMLPGNRTILGSHMGYVPGDPKRYPFLFDTSDNQVWAGWRGIETWTADCYVDREKMFPGLTLVHCRHSTDLEDQQETALYGWKWRGDFSKATAPKDSAADATYCLDFKPGYRFGITALDCEFLGHDAAYKLVDDDLYTRFERCTFDCPTINYLPMGRMCGVSSAPWTGEWIDCTFIDNPVFADGWYPKYDLNLWLGIGRPDRESLHPVRYFIKPWHDGRDYQVYHYEQLPTFARPVLTDPTQAYGDWPVGVNTHEQLIALGTPIFGDVVPADAVPWGKFYAKDLTPPVIQTATVSDIGYATYGGPQASKHLSVSVTISDEAGQPVSGAVVTANVARNGTTVLTSTATTGVTGVAVFTLSNAKAGVYTTVVTDVQAAGRTWDGNGTANSYTKP